MSLIIIDESMYERVRESKRGRENANNKVRIFSVKLYKTISLLNYYSLSPSISILLLPRSHKYPSGKKDMKETAFETIYFKQICCLFACGNNLNLNRL